jgi:hypothetical protein
MPALKLCPDDPLVASLREVFGQNVVRVPEERYRPLTVLAGRDRRLEFRGELAPLLTGEPLSVPSGLLADSRMANLTGKRSRAVQLSLGLKILEGFLGGFGVPSASISAAFAGASEVAFRFDDIVRSWADINAVGALLRGRRVDPANPAARVFLRRKPHAFLVLDSVVTSTDFTISVEKAASADFSLDVPTIEAALGEARGAVKVTSRSARELTFRGDRRLAFAFGCVRIRLGPGGSIEGLEPDDRSRVSGPGPDRPQSPPGPARILLTGRPALLDIG